MDRIRRQKADLEDILTHVQGETPETARLLANSMAEERRTPHSDILREHGGEDLNLRRGRSLPPRRCATAMRHRPLQRSTCVERFHVGYDEEKTLAGLVDDWDRYQRVNPVKSSVVLARTRAEARALSHLMRERRFADADRWRTVQIRIEPMRIE